MKKKIGILLGTIFLIAILPVIPSTIINEPITTNEEVKENSVATLKTSDWKPGFNYTMDVNASYNWVEINKTGRLMAYISGEDDDYETLVLKDIGFTNYKFFGRVYEYLNVCTNGWMTFSFDGDPTDYNFGDGPGRYIQFIPQDCTGSELGQFNSSVFIFGCDLNPGGSEGGIYYKVKGVKPYRRLIIEFYKIEEYSSDKEQTFQVIFFENGNFKFQYKKTSDIAGFNGGPSPTICTLYPTVGLDNGDLINYNNVSIDLLDFTNGVEKKAISFKLAPAYPLPLITPDDDDDDDEAGVDIGLVVIVITLVSIGAGVAVIIVLIKKGIIAIPKSR